LYRIENVGTRAVERITANDEERRRQGYELQTCFEFTGARDVRSRTLADDTGEIAYAKFAPAALVRRINRGLKRRSPSSGVGFWIEPKSGYWASAPKAGTPDEGARQRITPVVEDRKNTMLLRFSNKWLAELGEDREGVLATIQHALARGVEEVYQLEEGEIMVEPTPSSSNRRALLFYEAVEGGAGALSRLLDDREAFRRVALSALDIMHYSKASTEKAIKDGSGALESVEDARCVAACYRCLLSYFNQPDQELLDRRNEAVLSFLLRLAAAVPAADEAPSESDAKLDGCPPHDKDPLPVEGFEIRWIWRSARIAAVDHAGMPKKLEEKLTAKGIELVVLPPKGPERAEKIRSLAKMLGATSK
jgi:hypothetical protein